MTSASSASSTASEVTSGGNGDGIVDKPSQADQTWIYVAAGVGGCCCLVLLLALVACVVCRRRRSADYHSSTMWSPTRDDVDVSPLPSIKVGDVYQTGTLESSASSPCKYC
jgi:hypothetical protein